MTERTGLLLASALVAAKLGLAVALLPACIPPPKPEPMLPRSGGGSCATCLRPSVECACCPPSACRHELLTAEVTCSACGQLVRIEERRNRGAQ